MHVPVLLQSCLQVLAPKPGDFFIDGTLGAGGHAREVIERIQPGGIFLGVDRDPAAVAKFRSSLEGTYYALDKLLVEQGSYAELPGLLSRLDLPRADGLLLDLGFSSEQIGDGDLAGRGFSFGTDEPLLMTYDPSQPALRNVLPELSETELARIITEYGEERYAARIAKSIAQMAKKGGGIQTTSQLVAAIKEAVPAGYERGRIHPATRTFQALRIYINQELAQLENLLDSLEAVMRPGSRVAIISFHSLEDRIVKNKFRELAHADQGELLTKKPITATEEEILRNPRSRSAKLRAIRLF
ncbi:MAG: 16S rRNA (cytosine(1402)-N(4))-methyltransferase [Candidatus Harrisonbacteria bacterium CG10_big_fil_rev_8_21_14_0_10_49_15]|uniref:Ribosomal RNA small subunit methyltransferase H n=1 Tax=Candidatus Harrisonbacteria bacterium CG10_big_fil_rev_8_21_14_0_10_49_15 TaxID=1974587 RepID=A0A2H0UL53_9BACT|nr:MAG: 16S rRNA (cytosine(1402)-N(4))-methyltransferase [Candidatus Harrisonbacteria bacterium CG10_big_fil_rev_8_21_14_0_10_49_15]